MSIVQFKNNLGEKAKADTRTPDSRPGRDIHYNKNDRFHTTDGCETRYPFDYSLPIGNTS